MAKISVHIEAETGADYRAALMQLVEGIGGGVPINLPLDLPKAEVDEAVKAAAAKVKAKKAAESKPEPATTSVPETPTEPPAADPAPVADPAPAAKEKKISLEDLRGAMQPLKREVSLQLVAEFSGKAPEEKSKLSDVPDEKRAELLAEARRLTQLPENVKQAIA